MLCKCSGKYIDIYFILKITCLATCPRYGYRMLDAHAWWGFDSCMGLEYSVVITLASRVFRVLLSIPPP